MVVICGISAWEYFCTPPILRETELPEAIAINQPPFGAGIPSSLLSLRSNASEASRIVSGRLLHDLKGIPLPINVYSADGSNHRSNNLVSHCATPCFLPKKHLIKLGNDLYVTSPELTLVHLSKSLSWQQLALLMLEACGLFTTFRGTLRSNVILDEIGAYYRSRQHALFRVPAVSEFSDEHGRPLHRAQPNSPAETWSPCFDRLGRMTDL